MADVYLYAVPSDASPHDVRLRGLVPVAYVYEMTLAGTAIGNEIDHMIAHFDNVGMTCANWWLSETQFGLNVSQTAPTNLVDHFNLTAV